jgi:hypothetical protein
MQNEWAHGQKPASRRQAGHLSQTTTMPSNLVRCDAAEPMRPRNYAQGAIRFSAVIKMNAYRNQLSQKIRRGLAKPSALLLRPSIAGSIG